MSLRDALIPLLERYGRSGGILAYHGVVDGDDVPSPALHVGAATLQVQLEYVRARYDVIPLRELVARRARGRPTDRCLALTFDDGYVGVETLAAPILARLDLPATVFVTVAAAERGGVFWWDQLEHARRHGNAALWRAMPPDLGIAERAASPPDVAVVRDAILSRRGGRLDLTPLLGALPVPMSPLLRAMDFTELRRLAGDARFEFGCHTMTHPALPYLASAEQEHEMREASRRLREELPRTMAVVAYPFGLYDGTTIDAASRAGMVAGVTMQPRALGPGDAALTLPRIGTSEDWSVGAIALRLQAALRPLFIAAMRGRHPHLPSHRRHVLLRS